MYHIERMEDGGEIVDLGGDGDQPAAPPMVETGLVDVRVYDPVRQGDGMAAAVFYKVDSKVDAGRCSDRRAIVSEPGYAGVHAADRCEWVDPSRYGPPTVLGFRLASWAPGG